MMENGSSLPLNYQLKLNEYRTAQDKKMLLDERYTALNKELTIGVLGLGYIGNFVAQNLRLLDYLWRHRLQLQ